MRMIHAADLHLGSAIKSKFNDEDITNRLKSNLVMSFVDMAEYAEKYGITVVMLSGDVFDVDKPKVEDKKSFYDIVASHPGIEFLYLKGNHDRKTVTEDVLENLKMFSDEKWTTYTYGDVAVTGREMPRGDAGFSSDVYDELVLDSHKTNVVMLHGSVGTDINLSALKGRNIDYLALGDIHKISGDKLDLRGMWQYCGCLMGRGFDETGSHGFFVYDTDKKETTFVPLSRCVIEEYDVDVSDSESPYDMSMKIRAAVKADVDKIYRINLVGAVSDSVDPDTVEGNVKSHLTNSSFCLFVSVKNKTTRKIDVSKYTDSRTVRGRFVRLVGKADGFTDDEKNRMISYGFAALDGKEIQ